MGIEKPVNSGKNLDKRQYELGTSQHALAWIL
jgi:hypothetical protein